jgi:hypothetical protein
MAPRMVHDFAEPVTTFLNFAEPAPTSVPVSRQMSRPGVSKVAECGHRASKVRSAGQAK